MTTEFTPVNALIGGGLIGLASVLLLACFGRIAGISGIAVKLLPPYGDRETGARGAFVLGLIAAPLLIWLVRGSLPEAVIEAGPMRLLLAGALVGFGAVYGSGCTSGHGVCGLSRLSKRSFIAVGVFMTTAILTVFVTRHWMGV